MGSDKEWMQSVNVHAAFGDALWYVAYETESSYLRLTHRGTWREDDMDIYWKSQAEAFAALHVAPCPLEDPYARIAALEATERELREAVKVLAEVAVVLKDVQDGDELWFGDFTVSRVAKAMANPIAAEAVREAGR